MPDLDTTRHFFRVRLRNPRAFMAGSFRWHTFSAFKGVHAVLAKTCDGCSLVVQGLAFEKSKWTANGVLAWVKSHKPALCKRGPRCTA